MARLSTDVVQLLLIPQVGFLPEAQILTLKHTLSKLGMLTARERETVSTAMLKYMQSLDSPESLYPLGFILDGLTVTEQEDLLSLVESAKQLLEKQESKKSTIPSSPIYNPGKLAGGIMGSPGWITGILPNKTATISSQDILKLQQLLVDIEKQEKKDMLNLIKKEYDE